MLPCQQSSSSIFICFVIILFSLSFLAFWEDVKNLGTVDKNLRTVETSTSIKSVGFNTFDNSTSLPSISKVFVINLDRRKDRYEGIKKQLDTLKIAFTRFPAVDFGSQGERVWEAYKGLHKDTKINLDLVKKKVDRHKNSIDSDYSWAQAGCWQTHLQILFDIVDNSATLPGPYLILEDDAEIEPRILEILSEKSLSADVPQDWNILALGYDAQWCFDDVVTVKRYAFFFTRTIRKGSFGPFCLATSFLNTDGYVIRNAEVARKLIAYSNMQSPQTADTYWHPLFRSKRLKAYIVRPRVTHQLKWTYSSDIEHSFIETIRRHLFYLFQKIDPL